MGAAFFDYRVKQRRLEGALHRNSLLFHISNVLIFSLPSSLCWGYTLQV